MKYHPSTFSEVELNSSTENLCSPKEQPPSWIGIKINAPTKLVVRDDDSNIAIPICGLYSLPLTAIAKSSDGLEIHVRVRALDKSFSGYMVDEDYGTDAPIPRFEAEEAQVIQEGVLLEAYFNPDIRDYVSFPLKEGNYSVFVSYGGETSNQVEIQVIIEDE